MTNAQREIAMSAVGLVATFGVFVGTLWAFGLLDFSGTETSSKIIAASIALVGTFFTAMVTFTGLLLRQSMERHRLQLQKDAQQQKQEESKANLKRMETEAAIKAAELFKATGEGASSAEIAGALFALSSLGQFRFALRLLSDLWPKEKIDSASAVYIVDDGLRCPDGEVQYLAAYTLCANAARLPEWGGSINWPSCIMWRWLPEMHGAAKIQILEAFVDAMLVKRLRETDDAALCWMALWLGEVVRTEEEIHLKGSAANTLRILLAAFDSANAIFHPQRGTMLVGDLKEMAKGASGRTSHLFDSRQSLIERWAQ